MADDVQVAERDEQASGSADDGAAPNGSSGSPFTLPAALAVGGAVAGALAALLGRRRAQASEPTQEDRPELTDDLASRASAAARGDEDEPERGETDPEEDVEGPEDSGETWAEDSEEAPEPSGEADEAAEPSAEEEEPGEDDVPPENDARADDGNDDREEEEGVRDDSPMGIARAAARQLQELTGRDPEAVLGVERDGDGWRVTLELVELSRTPSTTDVLGRYEVELGDDAEMREYRQVDRYVRGSGGR